MPLPQPQTKSWDPRPGLTSRNVPTSKILQPTQFTKTEEIGKEKPEETRLKGNKNSPKEGGSQTHPRIRRQLSVLGKLPESTTRRPNQNTAAGANGRAHYKEPIPAALSLLWSCQGAGVVVFGRSPPRGLWWGSLGVAPAAPCACCGSRFQPASPCLRAAP